MRRKEKGLRNQAAGIPNLKWFLFLFVGSICLLPSAVQAYDRRTPVVEAVEKSGPAVVNIRTEQVVSRRSSFFGFADPFFDQFFRDLAPPRTYKTQSLGSGVIVDPRGYILTNAHVIEKASKIFVALPGAKKEIEATLVGKQETLDLAVLRIEGGGNYPHLPLGDSSDLMLGETVIAIGNPLGLGHSITTGVISAPSRRIPLEKGAVSVFIQTDALINPGNSGGPLININGELIGINTAIARQAQGIGFSIPSGTARRVLGELIEFGRVRSSWFGISPQSVGRALARSRGEGGVLVAEVEPDSPAEWAGLRVADVILSLGGTAVESPAELMNLLRSYPPGSRVDVEILRGTREIAAEVQLRPLPPGYVEEYARRVFGLILGDGPQGLRVLSVVSGSAAQRAGVQPGDRIAELEGERLEDVHDFNEVMERRLGVLPLNFLVVRGTRGYYLNLP